MDNKLEVEIEVEYTRREIIRYTTDISNGMFNVGEPKQIGRFLHALTYWMHSGRDLSKKESSSLISWRIVQPCNKDSFFGDHDYERIPGSDQSSQCKKCGRVSGK